MQQAIRGKLLTTKEVASILRTSERWVQSHMKDGTFPVKWYLIGPRNHLCDSEDLNDWLLKIQIQPGTDLVTNCILEATVKGKHKKEDHLCRK
jgi:predicted DNA-binding transcriptional regulator AlpA